MVFQDIFFRSSEPRGVRVTRTQEEQINRDREALGLGPRRTPEQQIARDRASLGQAPARTRQEQVARDRAAIGFGPAATREQQLASQRAAGGQLTRQPVAQPTPSPFSTRQPAATTSFLGGTRGQMSQADSIADIRNRSIADYEASLMQDSADLDALFNSALNNAIAARGARGPIDLQNDPLLAQELAAIQQEYRQAQSAIQNNYGAAISQIQGYQTQADQLMQELAASQLAGIETAAGQSMAPAPGTGLSPEAAAAAGVSSTAVGGAGITGAAQLGRLGGVTTAQSAAGRIGAGSLLAEQLASGRLDEATMLSGLERSLSEAQRGTRLSALERLTAQRELDRRAGVEQADLRLSAAEAKRADATRKRETVAELRFRGEQAEADRIAKMTPQEFAQYAGTSRTPRASWAEKVKSPPANATPAQLDVNAIENSALQAFGNEAAMQAASGATREQMVQNYMALIANLDKTYGGSGVNWRNMFREAGLPTTPADMADATIRGTTTPGRSNQPRRK